MTVAYRSLPVCLCIAVTACSDHSGGALNVYDQIDAGRDANLLGGASGGDEMDASPADTGGAADILLQIYGIDDPVDPAPVSPPQDKRLCGQIGSTPITRIAGLTGEGAFAVGYGDGRVSLYSGKKSAVARFIPAHPAAVSALVASPDGKMLVSQSGRETKLWNATDGALLQSFVDTKISFSPDGKKMAIGTSASVQLVDVGSGTILWTTSGGPLASFSSDGTKILILGAFLSNAYGPVGGMKLVDAASGTVFWIGEGGCAPPWFDSQSEFLTCDGGGGQVFMYRMKDGKFASTRRVPWNPDEGTVRLKDGHTILMVGSDLVAVRVDDGQVLWTVQSDAAEAWAFSPDESLVALVTRGTPEANRAGTAAVRRMSDGALIKRFEFSQGSGTSVAFSSDGRALAVGLEEGSLRAWDLDTGAARLNEAIVPGNRGYLAKAEFSPDGSFIASLPHGGPLNIWKTSDHSLAFAFARVALTSFSISADGSMIAVGGGPRLVRAKDGSIVWYADRANVAAVALSPDGKWLAGTGGYKQPFALEIWRVVDGVEEPGFGMSSSSWGNGDDLLFSPDSRSLVSTVLGNQCPPPPTTMWDVAKRSPRWSLPSLPGLSGCLKTVARFSPDGIFVAIGSGGRGVAGPGLVRIHQVSDGQVVNEFPVPGITDLAYSPDGTMFATATQTAIRVFRTTDWSSLTEFPGPAATVAFSPDNQVVLAGGIDSVLRLYCNVDK